MHFAADYIGLAYGRPFHCWSFVCHVQKLHFKRDLPDIAKGGSRPQDLLIQARQFQHHPERVRWRRVEHPQEGDCVLLKKSRYPSKLNFNYARCTAQINP